VVCTVMVLIVRLLVIVENRNKFIKYLKHDIHQYNTQSSVSTSQKTSCPHYKCLNVKCAWTNGYCLF